MPALPLSPGSFRLATSREEMPSAAWSFHGPGFYLDIAAGGDWACLETARTIHALSGEAYWNGERVAVERLAALLEDGAEIPAALDGSFLLLIVDRVGGACTICVDRTASKKVFYCNTGTGWLISDRLPIAAGPYPSLNAGALAAYLLNGIPLGGQTLFEGLRILAGGNVARLAAGHLIFKPYFRYDIDEAFAGRSEKQLVADFGDLLFSGISARLRNDLRPAFLSLSGGYDSTCILASALRVLGPGGFRAFSYETTDGRSTDADASIAADVCRHWKVEHQTVLIPSPSLREIVEGNAQRAFATANPCTELAVWETLDQRLGFASRQARLFFGDNAFGHDPNWRLSTRADALAWLPMPTLDEFELLRPFFLDAAYDSTQQAFAGILDEVLARGSAIEQPVNIKDFFYYDQRVQHALMPWRDRFCNQHGAAVNPLLDGRVLDYYRHVPHEYRRRRKLYRKTVETMYPEFFQRKRATSYGSSISPRSLLQDEAPWVEERMHSLHPAIAAVASTESLLALLPGLTTPAPPSSPGWKSAARRVLKNTALGETVRSYFPRNRGVARDVILLRLLIADASVKLIVG